jgi:integrase
MVDAIIWRDEARVENGRGLLRASQPLTVADAARAWLEGPRAGRIRNRSGDVYKPSALRGYEDSLRLRLLPAFGAVRFDRLARVDLQNLVKDMLGDGFGPSTIRNTLMPLRAMYLRAVARADADCGIEDADAALSEVEQVDASAVAGEQVVASRLERAGSAA